MSAANNLWGQVPQVAFTPLPLLLRALIVAIVVSCNLRSYQRRGISGRFTAPTLFNNLTRESPVLHPVALSMELHRPYVELILSDPATRLHRAPS